MNCKEHNYHYFPEINEAGWRCVDCDHKPGEPAGYSPQLDRELIKFKVGAILHDAHDANLIYISNGSQADYLGAVVSDKCQREGRFDQYSILLFLLEQLTPEHSAYWRLIGEGVINGNDKRDRCHCGQLANSYSGGKRYCSRACMPTAEAEFAF